MTSKSHSDLLPKKSKSIQVLRSNYGSMDVDGHLGCGPFGASPSPPPNDSVQHSLHLSNIPRNSSTPLFPVTPLKRVHSNSVFKDFVTATIHSPYFRTLSPQVSYVRKPSIDSLSFPPPPSTTDTTKAFSEGDISTKTLIEQQFPAPKKIGVWGAGFSILNLFLGLGLLSFPYALAQGSFTAFGILALTCFLMSYTGKLIVRCFDSVPLNERTYPKVGFLALHETLSIGNTRLKWGNVGMGLVTFGILCEFIGALCMSTIFIWDNVSYLLPELQMYWVVLAATCAILPTCWMLNVSELAFNAFLGCVCKIFTVSVIVITFLLDTSVVEREKYEYVPDSPTRFSISVGIFILSYAGHACLPEIYTSMKEPERFERVLDICFVIMFFTYSGMALFGYLQYGKLTNVIITENLISNETGRAKMVVAQTLIGFVIASCYFQVSPILSVVSAIPEDFIGIESAMKKRMFRTFLFLGIIALSWSVIDNLAILEAVTGSLCTMITSVICPSLFYFGLNHKSVSNTETVILFMYLIGGVLIGIYLLYNDIIAVMFGQ